MSEPHCHAVDPESLRGCRLRVSFHFKELQRKADPIVRANVAQHLAEATARLADLEAEQARLSRCFC